MNDVCLLYDDENIQYPSHVSFELTSTCNYKCKHCYNDCEPNKNEKYLNKDKIINILNQLREIGVLVIELTGGEPFLHPDFKEILTHCLKLFNIVAVITNGSLITEKFLKSLKEQRHKLSFQIPLHSVDGSYMDDFCGNKGSFTNSKRAIKLLTRYGFLTRVGMIVTPNNLNSMIDTAKFVQSFIMKNSIFGKKLCNNLFFAFSIVIPIGRSNSFKNLIIDSEEVFREMQHNLKICDEKFGDFIYKDDPKIYDDDQHCGVGVTSVTINNLGDLKLCVMCPNIKWGNVLNEDLKTILSNERTKYFANLKVPNMDTCGDCRYLWFCNNCSTRGIIKYQEIGDKCTWGREKMGGL
ncbi:MAG: radical SAM protein [Methanobrevibacter sp.]|jgi:MoaA/NifB/PqqE/SkfB family radical SAM enzyme|nr:radical SAM protein [Candidatus Methanovirga aequatorialis]